MFVRCNAYTACIYIYTYIYLHTFARACTRAEGVERSQRGWHTNNGATIPLHAPPRRLSNRRSTLPSQTTPPPLLTTVRYSSELHIARVDSWKIMKKTAEPFPAGRRMNGEAWARRLPECLEGWTSLDWRKRNVWLCRVIYIYIYGFICWKFF